MKIISVSGKNLASLEGEFVIDFEKGVLGRAGLFAITGPTGAGKSTILDALCVALFDKTPRLSQTGGALIGRADEEEGVRLGSNDVRSLLRRGAGSGFAQVVFVGRDGQRYQARWTVRRSRESAGGRFQPQSLELRNVATGQGLGGTRTETLQQIQELLGLTYEQFCRSVLLAQGDFAAFLKAGERERSDLLERITGIGIYGKISVAAFRRMKDEEQLLSDLTRKKEETNLLDEGARTGHEENLAALAVSLKEVQERYALAEKAEEWFRRRLALKEGITVAEAVQVEAAKAWEEAEGLRVELANVTEVQTLRLVVEEADGALERANLAALAVERNGKTVKTTREHRAIGRKKLEALHIEAASAEKGFTATRPLIAKAIELDTCLSQAHLHAADARNQVAQADESLNNTLRDLDRLSAEKNIFLAQVVEAMEWLEAHESITPVADQWSRWRLELQRFIATRDRHLELSQHRARLLDDREQTISAVTRTLTALETARGKEVAASAERITAEERATAIDATLLLKERVAHEKRRDVCRTLHQVAVDAAGAVAEQRSLFTLAKDAEAGAASASADRQQAALEGITLEATLAEAERALLQARAAQSLEQRRAELQEGEPCPLCGSIDHPWSKGSPLDDLLETLELRTIQLRRSWTEREKTAASATEREGSLLSQSAAMKLRCMSLAELVAGKQNAWEDIKGHDLDLPGDVREDTAVQRAAEALGSVEQKLREMQALEEQVQVLGKGAHAARIACDVATTERDQAAHSLLVAEQQDQVIAEKLRTVTAELDSTGKDLDSVVQALSEPFAAQEGWQSRLEADPHTFLSLASRDVELWMCCSGKKDAAKKALSELEPQLEGCRGKLEELRRIAHEKETELSRRGSALELFRKERQVLLDGRPVDRVEAELTAGVSAAQAALEIGRAEMSRLESEHAGAASAENNAKENLQVLKELADKAGASLSQELLRRSLSEEVLRLRLAYDQAWLEQQREYLASIDNAMYRAQTVLEERRRARDLHKAEGEPALQEEEITSIMEAARAEISVLDQRRYELRHLLTIDDDARSRHASLLPLVAAQLQKTDLWRKVSDLIGSADGKKFRTFAQSLTLEQLLGYANEHLRSLAPRYAIIRVPSSEMELQMVDRDMGDEIRSVNSLSGGESFLVSLALALGLSSLSSHTTQVESLFIDEGFGSLDPDTLEVALATLDSLQASGRKVGIISHVPGLAERIGVTVEVVPVGGGRSRVSVAG